MQINVHGNSATATKLKTSRNISLNGAVKGNANFDGSGNVVLNTTQNNIAVVTGNVTLSSGSGTVEVPYPSGFTYDNCVVISLSIFGPFQTWTTNTVAGMCILEARFLKDTIVLRCNGAEGFGSTASSTIKAVLLKIN